MKNLWNEKTHTKKLGGLLDETFFHFIWRRWFTKFGASFWSKASQDKRNNFIDFYRGAVTATPLVSGILLFGQCMFVVAECGKSNKVAGALSSLIPLTLENSKILRAKKLQDVPKLKLQHLCHRWKTQPPTKTPVSECNIPKDQWWGGGATSVKLPMLN